MPVPSSITTLSTDPTLNSPAGSEPIGNNADDYLRAAFAFIKQVYSGTFSPTVPLAMNTQRITNLGAGTAKTDAVTLAQLQAVYKYGEVKMWWGTATNAAVATAWGPGWYLCDGTNGTPNFMDRVPVAAGVSYATGTTGGNNAIALNSSQLPNHSHGISDPGHAHAVYDPSHAHGVADGGHAHGVSDPGHVHSLPNNGSVQAGSDNGGAQSTVATGYTSGRGQNNTNSSGTGIGIAASGTGIGIYGAVTNIGIYGAGTGISVVATGSNAAVDIRQPFVACSFIMYTGAGV